MKKRLEGQVRALHIIRASMSGTRSKKVTLITDFKNIFELFPIDSIDITFLNLISIDLTNSIRTILLVKEENFEIIFSVLINYFKCCEKHNIKKVNFEINKLD